MNDRQRLEAIVAVVCKYLPPDGISREQAIGEIIGLIDPLPPQEQEQEPVAIGDIRALKHRIHELEGEVIGYKQILDAQPEQGDKHEPDEL